MSNKDNSFEFFLVGFIAGCVSSAIVSILYAPKSGEETRKMILEKSEDFVNSANKSIDRVYKQAEIATNNAVVAGAFTGADKLHKGLIEAANDGILFLDEISSMSTDMQAKLLRALESKKIRRVGGTQEIDVDVQIVAATNHDIPALIEEGKFRSDLFYRLNVIHIELPPLRERKEDIPKLCGFFIRKLSMEQGKNISHIDPAVLTMLMDYDWPGNIRELRNACLRAVIFCNGDTIRLNEFSI